MTLDLDPAHLTDKGLASLLDSTARINIWDGSVRSTKTTHCNLRWLDYVAGDAPPGKLMFGGKTKDTIIRNVIDPMQEIVGTKALRVVGNNAFLFGRKIHIIGGNDEGAELRLRGLTLAGAYVDEITVTPESYVKMLLSRLSVTGAKLFGTTNPGPPNHWLKKEFLDKADVLNAEAARFGQVGIARFHFTLDDNPHLDPAYVASLKAEYGGPGTLFYMRFIDGLWVMAEGAIYSMFERQRHVTQWLPHPEEIRSAWVAVDYGTTNPFVAGLFVHVTEPYEHIMLAAEWWWDSEEERLSLSDAQYAARVRAWLAELDIGIDDLQRRLEWIFIDPSAKSFIIQLYNDGMEGVAGARNEVIDGIRGVTSLLAMDPPRLIFHEECEHTIEGMEGYVWDPKAQQRGEDAPLKKDDHGPDMVRYGVHSRRDVWETWVSQPTPVSV